VSQAIVSAEPRSPPPGGLAATLARIGQLGVDYELRPDPSDDNWLPASEIVSGGAGFQRVIERLEVAGRDPATTRAIGSRFVLLYLRFVWPAVAAFALERRVPDVAAENLLVRLDDTGWPKMFALAKFTARDEAGLAHWLLERSIERNAAPLVETVRARLLTSGSALWGNVAAAFAHPLLWHVQHVAPDSATVVHDAETLLDRRDVPNLREQVRLLRLVHADEEWTVHARRTCCLRWCLPDETRCDDCPLTREPRAGEFLRARLAEAIARGEALRAELGLEGDRNGARRFSRSA
jgi:siderophore-iron reductase FhuF